MMTNKDWKKNDALMKVAMKKMGLKFKRNAKTWEAQLLPLHLACYDSIYCYDIDDNIVDDPSTPEILGEIQYFCDYSRDRWKTITNIFFGVKSYEELKIKLDLMA